MGGKGGIYGGPGGEKLHGDGTPVRSSSVARTVAPGAENRAPGAVHDPRCMNRGDGVWDCVAGCRVAPAALAAENRAPDDAQFPVRCGNNQNPHRYGPDCSGYIEAVTEEPAETLASDQEAKRTEALDDKAHWEAAPTGSIQLHPSELDYVNAKLSQFHDPEDKRNSFLGCFLDACLRADGQNYPLLRPALLTLMEKYPADPERLRMERIDSGREPAGEK